MKTRNLFVRNSSRHRGVLLFGALVTAFLLTACGTRYSSAPPVEFWSDMARQPKVGVQASSAFFANHTGSRPPVPGTVAVGMLKENAAFYTGQQDGFYVNNPLAITPDLMARGEERYNIYCAPCHDRTGSGRGIVGIRAQGWVANSLIDSRISGYSDGELFYVISNGRRSMPGYRWQIPEKDRWAIVAYTRALQRAANGKITDVPAELRSELR
ncbi:MAG: cytochrome c [Bryobacterales bacterium]|nr:cytochrome c [Bryobacterales bacterium]